MSSPKNFNCGDPRCRHCNSHVVLPSAIDPESVAGTPVPIKKVDWMKEMRKLARKSIGYDKNGNSTIKYAIDDDDQYELFADDDDVPSVTSYIWSAEIKASYTGLNQIEKETRYAQDIVAPTKEAAEQVAKNLYDSCMKDEFPTLESLEVCKVRDFSPTNDKGKTPSLTKKPGSLTDSEVYGMNWDALYTRMMP